MSSHTSVQELLVIAYVLFCFPSRQIALQSGLYPVHSHLVTGTLSTLFLALVIVRVLNF